MGTQREMMEGEVDTELSNVNGGLRTRRYEPCLGAGMSDEVFGGRLTAVLGRTIG